MNALSRLRRSRMINFLDRGGPYSVSGRLIREMHMDWREHIDVDPEICHGQAHIEGTRILVSVVLDNLAAGVSAEDLRKNYPSLTREDIRASIAYAAELSREVIVDVPRRTA